MPDLTWVNPPEKNFIDRLVFAKLKLLQIPPSDLNDDAAFCRRVHLDVVGMIPTPEDVNAFLKDRDPEKRSRLIDRLLERPEYVNFWTLKWADRLGCNQRFTGVKGAMSFHRWIRDQIAFNTPLDQFARTILTAKGPNFTYPPASFYRRIRSPEDAVETVSQVFMGVRVGCAKCHNHVAERWTQDDYYGMAAFFSQVKYKNGPQNFAQYNKEETVYLVPDSEVRQPRTGAVMKPRPLGGGPVDVKGDADRREKLADWLVSPANPFFAKAAVNRIWYHLMGRGIVEPVERFPRVESPRFGRAVEGTRRRLRRPRIRRQADDPPDTQQPRLSALLAAEPVQRGGHALFLARDGADAVGRAIARLGVPGGGGPGGAIQPASRHAGGSGA